MPEDRNHAVEVILRLLVVHSICMAKSYVQTQAFVGEV